MIKIIFYVIGEKERKHLHATQNNKAEQQNDTTKCNHYNPTIRHGDMWWRDGIHCFNKKRYENM